MNEDTTYDREAEEATQARRMAVARIESRVHSLADTIVRELEAGHVQSVSLVDEIKSRGGRQLKLVANETNHSVSFTLVSLEEPVNADDSGTELVVPISDDDTFEGEPGPDHGMVEGGN